MKSRLQRYSLQLAYSFCGVILVGAVLSGLFTTDSRWMYWHFSRLGEGGTVSAVIFNIAILVSAVIMFALGSALNDNISHISKISGVNMDRAKTIIYWAFNIITICFVGVATLPFDKFPVLHNIFGYSMFMTFLFMCVMMSKILPIFSRRFYIYGRLMILFTILSYALFLAARVITLLGVEVIMFILIYIWLLLFVHGILREVSSYKKHYTHKRALPYA